MATTTATATPSSTPSWYSAVLEDPKGFDSGSTHKSRKATYRPMMSNDQGLANMILRSATRPPTSVKCAAPSSFSKQRRPVQFAQGEDCIIPCKNDDVVDNDDDQQHEDLWFSKQELKAIRAAGRATLAKVQDAGGDASVLDEDHDCVRGLEHGLCLHDTADESEHDDTDAEYIVVLDRKTRRQNIVRTILDQQREQAELGICCAKGLSVTSVACTKWARNRAKEQGADDFQQALNVWKQDEACAQWLQQEKEPQTAPATDLQTKIQKVTATVATALSFLEDEDLEF